MPYHHIRGLHYAAPCLRPEFIKKSRPKGAKAKGLAYERAVGTAVGGNCGQWFHYIDAQGPGWCQTDVLLVSAKRVVVLECKLTDTEDAVEQLLHLYFPVLREVYRLPVYGVVVTKNLTQRTDTRRLADNLQGALALAKLGEIPVLQWDPKHLFPLRN